MAVVVVECRTFLVGGGFFNFFIFELNFDVVYRYQTAQLLSVRTHHGGEIGDCIISSKQETWRRLAQEDIEMAN